MPSVELITGPAGAGKSARAFSSFRDELLSARKHHDFGTALWITPTQRSRKAVAAALTNDELPVCFAPQVVTFEEFAERILTTAPGAIRPISQVTKKKLLRDLIDSLNLKKRLPYFGRVAGTPGFLELCVSFISELKREEIWPEHFLDAGLWNTEILGEGTRKNFSSREQELGLIYAEYQNKLHQSEIPQCKDGIVSGLYDGEGRFWSARTFLKKGHLGPFRRLNLIVVDGFTDFTRTQYEILGELSRRSQRTIVTLPLDAGNGRRDLFAKTYTALQELHKAFGSCEISQERLDLSSAKRRSILGHLSSHLFENPRNVPKLSKVENIRVLSCIRTTGELSEVARRIKKLLLGGVPADDIVVAFRSITDIAAIARETFENVGIPVAVETGHPIAATGGVRIAFSLLDLERDDWAFTSLMTLLNSSLFRPNWPDISMSRVSRAIGTCLRKHDIDRGRETILNAVNFELTRVNRSQVIEDLPVAAEFLARLADTLTPLRERATFGKWVDTWLALANELGISPRSDGSNSCANDRSLALAEKNGWQAFVRVLEDAKKAESILGGRSRLISLSAFRKQAIEALAGQTWNDESREDCKVRVVSAEQVRALDIPHLFLCGLNEGAFPAPRSEDCFISETERARLNELGLPLGHRSRHNREEMLLFYGVITRARTSLTLSYSSVNESGETLNRSPFLTAVLDLIDESVQQVESCGSLAPVPTDSSECSTEAETRVFAMAHALDGQAGLFATLADRPESQEVSLNIAAAVDMAVARFSTPGLTNYEGVLSDPRNLKRLKLRYGSLHEFSVTELETYAKNPFRFFLMNVLGLNSLAVPGLHTDYARRGSELHSVLARLHQELSVEAFDNGDGGKLVDLFRNAISERFAVGTDSQLHRVMREIEREVLHKLTDVYSSQWRDYIDAFRGHWDSLPQPTHLEVPFGNAPPEESGSDEQKRENPVVEFGTAQDRVRLRGRIDRIDTGSSNGRAIFNVVDYKLSRQPPRFNLEDVALGLSLQLPVYSITARRLGLIDGDVYQFGFWSLGGDGFAPGLKTSGRKLSALDRETMHQIEETLDRVIPQLVDRIREGQFPIPTDESADQYYPECAAVARSSSFRALAEDLQKQLPSVASE